MRFAGAVCVAATILLANAVQLCVGEDESPLFVTPYLDEGRFIEARAAARVPSSLGGGDVESYSGYFTVDAALQSNLFFWFFPAENNRHKAPLVLWLQGGPGASSLFGVFAEHGPFSINDELELERREHYWSQEMNVLYIDNPVGTGFSFTKSDEGYARDQEIVGNNLYVALTQFFQLFPELQQNKFFLTGEAYAGRYIPTLAHVIHEKNPTAEQTINLEGFAIGDGWVDPRHMMIYSELLYQHGIIDENTATAMRAIEKQTTDLIDQGKYHEASTQQYKILGLMSNISGPINPQDYTAYSDEVDPTVAITDFLAQSEVRSSLHVGQQEFSDGSIVAKYFFDDITRSSASFLSELLDQYRVMLYNGQFDIVVAYPLMVNYVKSLKWSGAEEYLLAPRKQWYVDNKLAGFTKTVKGFTEVLVRDAGHMVALKQPLRLMDLITHFTQNIPL